MIRTKEIYEELEQCTDDDRRLDLLFELTTAFLNFDEKRALEVAEEIGQLAERTDSNLGRSYHYSAKGRVLFKKSQFAEANKAFEKALDMALLTDNLTQQAICMDTLGIIYALQGRCEKAIEASMQAMGIFRQLPNTLRYQIVCYNNIGNAYKRMDDFVKAEEVYLLGLALAKQDGDTRMEANILNNLSAINLVQLRFKEALKYATPALVHFKNNSHKHGEVHATVFIGHCYLGMGEYAKAMDQYLVAQKLLKQVDHKPIEAQVYKGIAEVYVKMQAVLEALKNYHKALDISIAIEDYPEICDLNIDLAKLYINIKDYAKAKEAIDIGLQITHEHGLPIKRKEFQRLEQILPAQ